MATIEELSDGGPKITTVAGKEIGVFRQGDAYYAVLNYCPHFGAPVCRGKIFAGCVTAPSIPGGAPGFDAGRHVLRCPWHHWEFDLATGQALAPVRQRLKTYPVRVQDGRVWIDI